MSIDIKPFNDFIKPKITQNSTSVPAMQKTNQCNNDEVVLNNKQENTNWLKIITLGAGIIAAGCLAIYCYRKGKGSGTSNQPTLRKPTTPPASTEPAIKPPAQPQREFKPGEITDYYKANNGVLVRRGELLKEKHLSNGNIIRTILDDFGNGVIYTIDKNNNVLRTITCTARTDCKGRLHIGKAIELYDAKTGEILDSIPWEQRRTYKCLLKDKEGKYQSIFKDYLVGSRKVDRHYSNNDVGISAGKLLKEKKLPNGNIIQTILGYDGNVHRYIIDNSGNVLKKNDYLISLYNNKLLLGRCNYTPDGPLTANMTYKTINLEDGSVSIKMEKL